MQKNGQKTKQCVLTCWNSIFAILQSVDTNLDDLQTLSSDMTVNKNMLRLLADLKESLLKDVVSVVSQSTSS